MSTYRDRTSEWNKERQALKTMTTSKPSKEIKGHPPVTDRKSVT
ncbi:MAG: hypothetical protein E6713_15790 [Sporomusaceae bacterium]|nr:hypothetical protein [Sporomusaceae bacterium]